MKQALAGNTILITGASQGIGAAVAQAYAAAGATVVLTGRHQGKLEKVYDQIVAQGSIEPFALCFDFLNAKEAEFDQFAFAIAQATGHQLDGIVHCAVYMYTLSPIEFQTVDEWVNQYRINTVAPMALTRACMPLLQKSADASIIYVSESHSIAPAAYWGGFGASKAGLNYLGQVLAQELERFENLRVNTLIPGPVHSPQRVKTHPGESQSERHDISEILPDFVYWASRESRGRSGEVVVLSK